MRKEIKPWQILVGSLVVPMLLLALIGLWSYRRYLGYSPREGDLIFQSLPHNELVDAIEGATGSSYSHCGIVVRTDRGWEVLEALGTVRRTPLFQWVRRGRNGNFSVYRIDKLSVEGVRDFIKAAECHLGKPYDGRYAMDDEAIYCSELIWKAYKGITGEHLGELVKLGDLEWKAFEVLIRRREDGETPLEREMITPVGLTQAPGLTKVLP